MFIDGRRYVDDLELVELVDVLLEVDAAARGDGAQP